MQQLVQQLLLLSVRKINSNMILGNSAQTYFSFISYPNFEASNLNVRCFFILHN